MGDLLLLLTDPLDRYHPLPSPPLPSPPPSHPHPCSLASPVAAPRPAATCPSMSRGKGRSYIRESTTKAMHLPYPGRVDAVATKASATCSVEVMAVPVPGYEVLVLSLPLPAQLDPAGARSPRELRVSCACGAPAFDTPRVRTVRPKVLAMVEVVSPAEEDGTKLSYGLRQAGKLIPEVTA